MALLLCSCAPNQCGHRPPAAPIEPSQTATSDSPKIVNEPTIRVRIGRQSQRLTIEGPDRVTIKAEPDQTVIVPTPLDLARGHGGWYNHGRALFPSASDRLELQPLGGNILNVDNRPYPGRIVLTAVSPSAFDVINHVKLETYLPGVLERELYDRWHVGAYQAQAVAARSYALACLFETPHRAHDVEDTQASQAYAGFSNNSKARQAVLDTRGVVLSYRDRVIKAYYSSTCGGAGLSPTEAFGVNGPPPLSPHQPCRWCDGTKHDRWSTITRPRSTLEKRLAAYGRFHRLPIKDLTRIKGIAIAERNRFDRPTRFVVTDQSGKRHLLRAESFRHACNWSDPSAGLSPPPHRMRLGSSFFNVTLTGNRVSFTDGRGLGHGVGLCQFGANRMAAQGTDPMDILRFYYHGASIERAY